MSASEQTSASKRDDEFFEAFRRLLWSYREIMSKHGYDLDRPSVSEAEAALSKFKGQPDELSKAQADNRRWQESVANEYIKEIDRLEGELSKAQERVKELEDENRELRMLLNDCRQLPQNP